MHLAGLWLPKPSKIVWHCSKNNCENCRRVHEYMNKAHQVVCTVYKTCSLRDPGIEPGSVPWQGTILPLNQPRSHVHMAISALCVLWFIFSRLSLCMMQAATVVPPTVRSMVHAKVSLQGGSQPNLCTRNVAALRASIRRSSVCDQVSCLNHSARLHRRHVLVLSQCAQFCAVSHRLKLRLCPDRTENLCLQVPL